MTTLEFMGKQLMKHRDNYERELKRGASEEVLHNIMEKIYHYETVVLMLNERMIEDGKR